MNTYKIIYNNSWSVCVLAETRAKGKYLGYKAIRAFIRISFKEFMAKTSCRKTSDSTELNTVIFIPAF